MKRLLSSLFILTFLALAGHRALAQDDMAPPPPPDNGNGDQAPPPDQNSGQYAPDQGAPPPDQGAPDQGSPDQGAPPDADQGSPDQGNDPGVSYQTFYDNLSDQGTWVQTDDYGYAFQPNVTDPNWAPYTDGHWVYTDYGWTWVSDEPWGWATYHYGRWVNLEGNGWCWVPGYRWAPAWVSWRYGGGYCGWAPLPPSTFIGVEFGGGRAFGGYHFGNDIDVNFHIGAGYYNFVPVGRMGDPNVNGVIVNRYNNYTIINQTTNITNINIGTRGRGASSFGAVRVGGPPLAEINAHAEHQIPTVRLTASDRPGRASMQGGAVSFYAPRVNSGSAHMARPAAVGRTISHATINRGDSLDHPMAVNNHIRPAAPTTEMIQHARMAQASAPATAKIATIHSPVKSERLTGLAPVTESRVVRKTKSNTGTTGMYHPQTQATGVGGYNHSVQNTPSYQPATQQPIRHTESKPAYSSYGDQGTTGTHMDTQTHAPTQPYRPATQGGSDTYRPQSTPAYRPATQPQPSQDTHPAAPYGQEQRSTSSTTTTTPAYHPAPQHTETHTAPAPAQTPRPSAAKPATKDDKKPGQ